MKVFRTKGIYPDLEVLLDRMFRGTVVTGSVTWNPAQGLINNENMEEGEANMGDGAGSTSGNLEGNAGEDIVQASSSKSHKRAVHKEAAGKKGKKLTGPAKLASQIDRLCSIVESRSSVSSLPREFDPYKEIMQTLKAIL
ncbi:uncharacterized protein J3R85_001519 [Psidium guajava]|nr:uncharacterized protein J3R85_001519 [Psidium guajava]